MANAGREIALEFKPLEDHVGHLSVEDRICVLTELANLLECRHFKASKRCSEFLDYVVRRTLIGNVASLKERALGIELFSREAHYDTNSDPVVRATAGEVRKKIAQHYQEGGQGSVQIVLPVGTYIPRFEIRLGAPVTDNSDRVPIHDAASLEAANAAIESPFHRFPRLRLRRNSRRIAALAMFGLSIAALAILLNFRQAARVREATAGLRPGPALATFWRPFALSQADTVAVFSDLRQHVESNSMGLSNYPNVISVGDLASPGVSGVGEVLGVHALDQLFATFQRSLRAKRSNFFTFDDAANENVIFLGSPLANPPLRLLQGNQDFVFEIVTGDSGEPHLAIVNKQPRTDEPKQFLPTPEELPIKDDYALIALVPGVRPDKRVLILAGITTFGTQAAAEFVSRNDSLKTLLSRLKMSSGGEIEPFGAVISVKINDEVPVDERIVAVHQY